jgi:hypothetical protein
VIRFGLVVAVVGLVVWTLARPPASAGAVPQTLWQRRGMTVVVGGLVIVWLGLLVVVGILR